MILKWVEENGRLYKEFDTEAKILVELLLMDIEDHISYKAVRRMLHEVSKRFGWAYHECDPMTMYASMKGKELFDKKFTTNP